MSVEYKPVHPEAKNSLLIPPNTAIMMRLSPLEYDQPIDPVKNYPCVTFNSEDHGITAVNRLIENIISDHGKVMTHRVTTNRGWIWTVWRVA